MMNDGECGFLRTFSKRELGMKVMLTLISLLTSACVSGPQFQEVSQKEGYAVVYIYRPYKYSGGFGSPEVLINDKKEFALGNGAYRPVLLKPGNHKIQIKEKIWGNVDEILTFNVKQGLSYYLRFELFKTAADQSAAIGLLGAGGAAVKPPNPEDSQKNSPFIDERVMDSKQFRPSAFFIHENLGKREIKDCKLAM